MSILYYTIASLVLVVVQTVVIRNIGWLSGFYDLPTLMVIYLGLFRPLREGGVVTVLLGVVMDHISGGPFGMYLVTYCWLFLFLQGLIRYFRVTNTFLFPIAVVCGILIQNLLCLLILFSISSGKQIPVNAMEIVVVQTLWAFATGSFIVGLLGLARQSWARYYLQRLGKTATDEN